MRTALVKSKTTYVEVQDDTAEQIKKETLILESYLDFRGALKQSEVLALDVLKVAEVELDTARKAVSDAVDEVAAFAGDDAAQRATLELKRR